VVVATDVVALVVVATLLAVVVELLDMLVVATPVSTACTGVIHRHNKRQLKSNMIDLFIGYQYTI
jgi:hypothetical protein